MAKGRRRPKVAERLCIPVGARVFLPHNKRTTTFINTVTSFMLSALPYPSTMSAPDAAAQGDKISQVEENRSSIMHHSESPGCDCSTEW